VRDLYPLDAKKERKVDGEVEVWDRTGFHYKREWRGVPAAIGGSSRTGTMAADPSAHTDSTSI